MIITSSEVYCDICKDPVEDCIGHKTPKEARDTARIRKWIRVKAGNRMYDVCPCCQPTLEQARASLEQKRKESP